MEAVYVRVPEDLKRAAEVKARTEGLSLNQFVIQAMAAAVGDAVDLDVGSRFDIETTLAFLTACAIERTTVTYKQVALRNGFEDAEWPRAHRMLTPHLYAVGHECSRRSLPMLTALIVYEVTGKPGPGLDDLAKQLGMLVGDRERFVKLKQEEAYEWGRRVTGGAPANSPDWRTLSGLWNGPAVDELLNATRGLADET